MFCIRRPGQESLSSMSLLVMVSSTASNTMAVAVMIEPGSLILVDLRMAIAASSLSALMGTRVVSARKHRRANSSFSVMPGYANTSMWVITLINGGALLNSRYRWSKLLAAWIKSAIAQVSKRYLIPLITDTSLVFHTALGKGRVFHYSKI